MLLGYAKYTIGNSDRVDILIKDTSISRQHAVLVALPDGRFQLIDLHTGSGTWIKVDEKFARIDHSPPLLLNQAVAIGTHRTTIEELIEMQKRRADIFVSYS